MRLSREELGALFAHLGKRQRLGTQPDPAARSLGPIAKAAVPAAAHAAAFSIGLDLFRDDAELALDRLRVLRHAIEWEELRASFAQRLRPIGTGEITPPRRPR